MLVTAEMHDEEGRSLLNTIDELRKLTGISHEIALPQIIVVGQQSSGKSSVLLAVSGLPFPAEAGVCTQFAIEIRCRRNSYAETAAWISPQGPLEDLDPERQQCIVDFKDRWSKQPIQVEEHVKDVIEEARIAMGLETGKGYSFDRLTIMVQGPQQEDYTIIDLPGLLGVKNDETDLVDNLVGRYLDGPNTITLAVYHGYFDDNNQRLFDMETPYWKQAIGVITAADMIDWGGNRGARVKSMVASTHERRPRYGWHIVRNLDSKEKRDGLDRDKVECKFFTDKTGSSAWKGMENVSHGIESLKQKIAKVLRERISSNLPEVLNKVDSSLEASKLKFRALGDERSSTVQQKTYLTEKARILKNSIRDSLEGRADALEIAFNSTSLRDKVRNANEKFADEMVHHGHTWEILSAEDIDRDYADHPNDPIEPLRSQRNVGLQPYPVSTHALLQYFAKTVADRQGRALRGTFDPVWVGTFFLQQSCKWENLVKRHAEAVFDIVEFELKSIIFDTVDDDTADALLQRVFLPNLKERRTKLHEKMNEVLSPYKSQYPATLNRLYATNLLKKNRQFEEVETELDVQLQAAKHIHRCMSFYYDVAINVLLDNVQSLGIENILLQGLEEIFRPESLADMDADSIAELAAESMELTEERELLRAKIHDMEQAKHIINKHYTRSFVRTPSSTPTRPRSQRKTSSSQEKRRKSWTIAQPATIPAIQLSLPTSNHPDQSNGQQNPSLRRSSQSSVKGDQKPKTKERPKQPENANSTNNKSDVFVKSDRIQIAQQA